MVRMKLLYKMLQHVPGGPSDCPSDVQDCDMHNNGHATSDLGPHRDNTLSASVTRSNLTSENDSRCSFADGISLQRACVGYIVHQHERLDVTEHLRRASTH
jgi:hypothetical protein